MLLKMLENFENKSNQGGQNAGKEAYQLKSSTHMLMGMQKGIATSGNFLAVSCKVKHTLTIWYKRRKAYVHMNIYRSFIHNSSKLQTTQTFIN